MMKLNKTYLIEHKNEINNTVYFKCKSDCSFQNSNSIQVHCYKSIIYKFTKNAELVTERRVVDVDRSYIYEEIYTKLTNTELLNNFEIIGNILDLIYYLENTKLED